VGTRNRAAGEEFKKSVVLHMLDHGFPEARPVKPRNLSEGLTAPGDIDGLPVALSVRNAQTIDFSSLLDEAESAAEWSDRPYGVAVHSRRGRDTGQCYAVVTLDTLLSLLLLLPSKVATTE
jgi:hypothetical protein